METNVTLYEYQTSVADGFTESAAKFAAEGYRHAAMGMQMRALGITLARDSMTVEQASSLFCVGSV